MARLKEANWTLAKVVTLRPGGKASSPAARRTMDKEAPRGLSPAPVGRTEPTRGPLATGRSQEPLPHGLPAARFQGQLHGSGQPGLGRFVPMPSDAGPVARDRRGPLGFQPALPRGPGHLHDDQILVHRRLRTHAHVGQTQLGLQVTVDDCARPTPAVTRQGRDGRARARRPANVRRGLRPGGPLGTVDADSDGHRRQTPGGVTHPVGRRVPGRSGPTHAWVPPGP
jgi:hypothetical protein